ncbi:hypothetical protein M378DRAFT_866856 [Amanita muscaria Koide BX008]|uniref:C2H2-type domain-containing protein n=1 Tax=Amanita muscaria (strain Koide BX008) TaxID=946122 RepID=A0A0C2WI19_AMAMK|nr:hypothetical protein M378DRAFT_866856 [Amanita muscaria Koide BX008]
MRSCQSGTLHLLVWMFQHLKHSQAHLRPYRCSACKKGFNNELSLNHHMRDSPVHKQVVKRTNTDTFCTICEKRFQTPAALAQHNASPIHRQRNTSCFVCPSKFKTPSALAQHVESSCRQLPFNRHHITAFVQSLDIASTISLRSSIEGSLPVLQLSRPLITYQALPSSFNGSGYQCHICRKTFSVIQSLEAHLNSPVHDEDEFKCPKCNTRFKLISGLVQHLESASCGLSNVTDVERRFASLTAPFSRLLML